VKDMTWMFRGSKFTRDLSKWDFDKVLYTSEMFRDHQVFKGITTFKEYLKANFKAVNKKKLGRYKEFLDL